MAIFAVLEWELGIVEAIIVIMSVGLSVDFVVHFGVGYIHTDSQTIEQERKRIVNQFNAARSMPDDPNPEVVVETSPRKAIEHRSANIGTRHSLLGKHSYRLMYQIHQIERETRVIESITRVGSAVFMAAFTTFAAGFSMTLSALTSFRQMGQFLMTISKDLIFH